MASLVRVAALTGYIPVMRALGADPLPHLREVGLSPDLLADPEHLLSASAAFRLLERSAAATGCSTLGLRMALERSIANLGVTSLVIAHQPTLRHVLQALGEFRKSINSTLVLHVEESGGEVIVREDFALDQPEPARQSSDLALGVLARLCFSVMADTWTPVSVCFAHEPPPPSERALIYRLFRTEAEFDAEFNALVLQESDLNRPNLRADPALANHARGLIATTNSDDESYSTSEEVTRRVILLLSAGRATLQHCAAAMGITARTLQRYLDDEGVTFSALLSRARSQMAAQYLANPRMRVTDVAEHLGYRSIGAFTRWYTQVHGCSPRQGRASRSR